MVYITAQRTPGFASLSLIWAASFVACVASALLVAILGLTVPGAVTVPLSIATGAAVGAVTASWLGNALLRRAGRRSRLLLVVAVAEGVAVVAIGASMIVERSEVLGAPPLYYMLVASALAVTAATMAARRLRSASGSLAIDALISAGLLAICVLGVPRFVDALCSGVVTCGP